MKETVSDLNNISSNSSANMNKANNDFRGFVEKTSVSLKEMETVLINQIGSLKQVADMAVANCNLVKSEVSKEIKILDDVFHNHSQKVVLLLENAGNEVKQKTDDIARSVVSSVETINDNIKFGMNSFENVVDAQIGKIDSSIAKYGKDISAFVNILDDRADLLNKKFIKHGEIVNSELDRLMVRSSNLE